LRSERWSKKRKRPLVFRSRQRRIVLPLKIDSERGWQLGRSKPNKLTTTEEESTARFGTWKPRPRMTEKSRRGLRRRLN